MSSHESHIPFSVYDFMFCQLKESIHFPDFRLTAFNSAFQHMI